MKGFKSFPEKTVLEYDKGVTAIVGPNGSGKSNIIEAIRWVMGEQSAKTLRGDRMNDVIFSGTHKRKPLNIAEVELVLDNSDGYLDIEFEEVSILRRISRSGESTYMINKQECLLRDILNLFMDSGLGRESFSVISQGRVEAVFNSKPEDRRGIFEEAAGVYKYKVRKQDAEKKLDETQENLDRVQDILYELESQLEPLRKQKDIAQSYLDQKEQLTDLDIGVTVWKIKDLTESLQEDKNKNEEISKELKEVNVTLEEYEETQAKQHQIIEDLEALRDELNEKIVKVVRKRERTEASLNLFDEKARHREEFIGEKEQNINQINRRTKALKDELNEVMKVYDDKNVALKNVTEKIDTLEEKRAYLDGDKEAQIEELRSDYIEVLQQQTSLKNERNYLEQQLTRAQKADEKMAAQVSELEKKVEEHKEKVSEKNDTYESVSEELLSLLKEFKEIDQTLKEHKEDLRVKNKRVSKTNNELERAKAKQSSLEEMQENYAGYYAGVRAVMQENDTLNGIIGTVAELIEIPKDYVQAIDTVLGSRSQFIVVENEKAGRDAINYLKRKKKGRATFLPLTTIKSRYIPKNVQANISNISGFVGIASELVENGSDVQHIIENLLGQTIVAETLEAANEIAREINFRNRVVSLEGDVINAGGSMTGGGGRHNNTSPIFSQKVELDQLTKFISENEKVIEQLRANQQDVEAEVESLEDKAQEVRVAGEEKRFEEQRLKSEVENLTTQLDRLERELKATTFEVSEHKETLTSHTERMAEVEESLAEIGQKVKDSNERMKLLSSEQENIDEEKEKIASEISSVNEERNDIREVLASVRTNRQSLENQIDQNNQQIEDLEQDIKAFDEEVDVGSKEELQERLEQFTKKQTDTENNQQDIKEKLQAENNVLKEITEKIEKLSGHKAYLTEEKSKLDIHISRNDVRMDHHLEYLTEEYKISFEEAKMLDEPEMSFEEAQKQVKLLKKGIDELGPVNLNSIKEFETVNERYLFLSKQQDDLVEAKAKLYNTMDEMDAIVEKQFKETFDRIQKEFSKVFPKMFGGGYAELVLSEPENLLETGIEIIAQPPGKRLTRLSLLSGGERALTAISLLFAIIQVNPIPFCILDEAEAALDDANVVRFGKYLEEFESDTQFIVITHRKGTMEHSDQLYGVTMQEKGISKIVSVSLSEAQSIEGVT